MAAWLRVVLARGLAAIPYQNYRLPGRLSVARGLPLRVPVIVEDKAESGVREVRTATRRNIIYPSPDMTGYKAFLSEWHRLDLAKCHQQYLGEDGSALKTSVTAMR
ncbi:MAG: hypothetical protein K8F92_19310 [Hyphomicrobium sp.]|uniref:hypothetical protein n=1 Tax=Hyphomicrobium sp. TaxID=82 RepID=UPI00132BBCB0|nr:hypothetical protein [Hyphomicrobium sp.]KAB2938992.1 MAG: hypothetical protein F9K20_17920 [Hyphomicrobium sp.]MBZ0211782.1 hypothetical protein [Hyphomicrobium sp.]